MTATTVCILFQNHTEGGSTPAIIYLYLYSHAIYIFFLSFGGKVTMILMLKQPLLTVMECNCMLCTGNSRYQESTNPCNTRNTGHLLFFIIYFAHYSKKFYINLPMVLEELFLQGSQMTFFFLLKQQLLSVPRQTLCAWCYEVCDSVEVPKAWGTGFCPSPQVCCSVQDTVLVVLLLWVFRQRRSSKSYLSRGLNQAIAVICDKTVKQAARACREKRTHIHSCNYA